VGTTSQQGDIVAVELTYNGDDTETRRLEVTRSDGRWVIAEDLGTG
jgi:ribosomal protein L27